VGNEPSIADKFSVHSCYFWNLLAREVSLHGTAKWFYSMDRKVL
jgi:hypothetical protein